MCWRQVLNLPKSPTVLFLCFFYFTIYLIISYFFIIPGTRITFINDTLRIGEHYSLIFLAAPGSPVFTDVEGANVFESRRCGRCFVTNNKGFLPMNLYDAVLILQENVQETALIQPDKLYNIETNMHCVSRKFRGCRLEPRIVALGSKETFDLCSFCDHLVKKKCDINALLV